MIETDESRDFVTCVTHVLLVALPSPLRVWLQSAAALDLEYKLMHSVRFRARRVKVSFPSTWRSVGEQLEYMQYTWVRWVRAFD